jgi:hypothetical protein
MSGWIALLQERMRIIIRRCTQLVKSIELAKLVV